MILPSITKFTTIIFQVINIIIKTRKKDWFFPSSQDLMTRKTLKLKSSNKCFGENLRELPRKNFLRSQKEGKSILIQYTHFRPQSWKKGRKKRAWLTIAKAKRRKKIGQIWSSPRIGHKRNPWPVVKTTYLPILKKQISDQCLIFRVFDWTAFYGPGGIITKYFLSTQRLENENAMILVLN